MDYIRNLRDRSLPMLFWTRIVFIIPAILRLERRAESFGASLRILIFLLNEQSKSSRFTSDCLKETIERFRVRHQSKSLSNMPHGHKPKVCSPTKARCVKFPSTTFVPLSKIFLHSSSAETNRRIFWTRGKTWHFTRARRPLNFTFKNFLP